MLCFVLWLRPRVRGVGLERLLFAARDDDRDAAAVRVGLAPDEPARPFLVDFEDVPPRAEEAARLRLEADEARPRVRPACWVAVAMTDLPQLPKS